ncbi:MAG: lytic transglycosylase domain-containing protein [Rhodothalassiaceae bacterium]
MTRSSNVARLLVAILAVLWPGWAQQPQAQQPQAQQPQAETPQAFAAWLEEVRAEARDQGISEATLERALADVRPLERVVQRDRNQAEFVETYRDYLTKRVSDWRINKGREKLAEIRPLIEEIGAKYGVQPRYIAAIWGMETNYGLVEPGYRLFDALATLAYDPRRSRFYRAQLFHALTILDRGLADYDNMTSSYGGAMGQPQFLPAAFLDYAVDYDGDGRRNIWTSTPDVLASIANYLSRFGWRDDQTWGRPVHLPRGIRDAAAAQPAVAPAGRCGRYKSLGPTLGLATWQDLGVRKTDGTDLPGRNLPAALIISDEDPEQGWLVYSNFCTIMAYNAAFKYALGVGLLSDRIWY